MNLFSEEIFSNELKIAMVKPVYKSVASDIVSNCLLVSVLLALLRSLKDLFIADCLILSIRIISYILDSMVSGFSTYMAVLKFVDVCNLDNRKCIVALPIYLRPLILLTIVFY